MNFLITLKPMTSSWATENQPWKERDVQSRQRLVHVFHTLYSSGSQLVSPQDTHVSLVIKSQPKNKCIHQYCINRQCFHVLLKTLTGAKLNEIVSHWNMNEHWNISSFMGFFLKIMVWHMLCICSHSKCPQLVGSNPVENHCSTVLKLNVQ